MRPVKLMKGGAKYETLKKLLIAGVVVLAIMNLPDMIRYIKIETM
ncbi:MAG TPA: hypothetical protein VE620_07065 [Myxococcales bacterium]|nr:hypothetical protein [Myxococcales bacterium]